MSHNVCEDTYIEYLTGMSTHYKYVLCVLLTMYELEEDDLYLSS